MANLTTVLKVYEMYPSRTDQDKYTATSSPGREPETTTHPPEKSKITNINNTKYWVRMYSHKDVFTVIGIETGISILEKFGIIY